MSPLFFVLSDLNSFPSGFPFHPSSSGLIQSFLSCHRSKALRPSCTNRLVHKLVLWSDQVADTRSQLTRKWIRERKCSHVFCPVLLGCFCCCSCLGRSQHSLPLPRLLPRHQSTHTLSRNLVSLSPSPTSYSCHLGNPKIQLVESRPSSQKALLPLPRPSLDSAAFHSRLLQSQHQSASPCPTSLSGRLHNHNQRPQNTLGFFLRSSDTACLQSVKRLLLPASRWKA